MAIEQLSVRLLMDARQYKQEARQAATATGTIGKSAASTGTATGKLDSQMAGLAQTAKFAIAGAAVGAVTKFGKDSVQAFLGFDDAMNQSLAIMGDVSEAMRDDMADAAREVGKTTRIGAEEAAEGFFFLASAGFDAEQSIAAMPQVAKFAQAGMFDMARATDLATDAQSALGLKSTDAAQNLANLTRVTDVFVKANVLANTSVEQISEALTNKAGAAMRAVGIEVEEGSAVLAAFADQGVKGAEAGTQFAIVLRDLQTRAFANKDAFVQAGIAVFDAQGEFRNMADILGDLEGRLAGMSDEQKKAELSTLGFTDKSISALTVLLGTSDAIREYEKALRDAGGTTQEVADKQLESFQGQLDLISGRAKDAQIALGEMITPTLLQEADKLVGVLENVSTILDAVGTFTGAEGAGGFIDFLEQTLPGAGVLEAIEFISGELGFMAESMFGASDAADVAAISTEDFATHAASLEDELAALHGQTDEVTGGTEELTAATNEAVTSEAALAFQLERAARAAQFQREQILKTRDELRNIHDPLFRVVSLNADLAAAQEAVADTSKDASSPEFRDAVIARAEVIADLENTLIELKNQGIDPTGAAARLMLEDLGVPPGVIEEIFGQFDALQSNFESRTFRATLSFPVVDFGDGGVAVRQGSRIFRQHGGPVSASQPYVVGERGPELFIPAASGQVISNVDIARLIAGIGGREVNYNIPITSTGNQNADAQLVGAVASVLRRMETL